MPPKLSATQQAVLHTLQTRTVRRPETVPVAAGNEYPMLALVTRLHPELRQNANAMNKNATVVWQVGTRRPVPKQVTCFSTGNIMWTNMAPISEELITAEDRAVGAEFERLLGPADGSGLPEEIEDEPVAVRKPRSRKPKAPELASEAGEAS